MPGSGRHLGKVNGNPDMADEIDAIETMISRQLGVLAAEEAAGEWCLVHLVSLLCCQPALGVYIGWLPHFQTP